MTLKAFITRFGCILCLLLCTSAAYSAQSKDKYAIYGSYNAGCIANSVELERNSPDYQVQIWGKGRNFGHPQTISYIEDLVRRTKDAGLPPLLIGDISLKNGGPFGSRSNHASHNTGLDVDIAFDFASPRKTQSELLKPKDVYIVKNDALTSDFDTDRIKLIYLAANDDRVDRIFVSPRIKEGMCKLFSAHKDSAIWLSRLRPWFGHKAHMHVRLKCPEGSEHCIKQQAVPEGDGCGYELMSWFLPPDPKAKNTAVKKKKKKLPKQCSLILKK
ncbi:penicillin-insensitive murein endopeptidase [Anaerobiospirillum thomasii]|uniref:Penicillin-insensitive murein endopeptidase n=1 Tax=Anaerobiospirillum thomasii TaxID=179995 RepID=A0A2X0VAZ8_9GAMM|nr:penicillin-insensitive murein endopeptidase [Anaerobiospirillum thomasii]SPT70306.1 Penicillin-insensitive murein endopeptidase precursor [Anaerobiospirillum thomasii]